MKEFKQKLRTMVIDDNPTFVQFLALCPTLGTTTSMKNGLSMGASVLFVLIFSNTAISAIRKYVPNDVRIPVYITIIATIVTLLELLLKTWFVSVYSVLGIFLPLITVNCLILGRAEAFASENNVMKSLQDAIAAGIAFMLSLTLFGAFREFLGTGAINFFGLNMALLPSSIMPKIFIEPVGAFIAFGMLAWIINEVKAKQVAKKKLSAKEA